MTSNLKNISFLERGADEYLRFDKYYSLILLQIVELNYNIFNLWSDIIIFNLLSYRE